jgi:hypothetical protein
MILPHPCNGVTGGQTFIEKQHEIHTHMSFAFSRRIPNRFGIDLKRVWMLV